MLLGGTDAEDVHRPSYATVPGQAFLHFGGRDPGCFTDDDDDVIWCDC